MSWIDLANAYGSVKHSLIHFSLEWYHVPEDFCELMWNYYEGLIATVMVGKLQTEWFRFEIGVFQGCTVSTILFNVGFNTSFAHLKSLEDECGYQFRYERHGKPLRLLQTGYADDLALVTGTRDGVNASENNEKVLKLLDGWLKWTRSRNGKGMKAKPKKCIASALCNGKAVNPQLKVWEENGKWFPRCLETDEVFKFLGKGLLADLSNKAAKASLKQKFLKFTELIDSTLLNGSQKVWIWENYAMSKFGWDFLITDVPPSFVEKVLQEIETRYLKKWTGLARSADPSILYRGSEDGGGLGLKEVSVEHKRQRLIRRHQLDTSKDPVVKEIHERFAAEQRSRDKVTRAEKVVSWSSVPIRIDCPNLDAMKILADTAGRLKLKKQGMHRGRTNEWKECQVLEKLRAERRHRKITMQPSENRAGVGYGVRRRVFTNPVKAERAEIMAIFGEIEAEKRLVEIMSKTLQGEQVSKVRLGGCPDEKEGNYFCDWLKWESALAVDTRWNTMMQKTDSYCKFYVNAVQDSLPTPSRLKTWKDPNTDGKCPLGCRQAGTLKHILCACPRAHNEKPHNRIKWRHDSILLTIYNAVKERVGDAEKAGNERAAARHTQEVHVNPVCEVPIRLKSESGAMLTAERGPSSNQDVFQIGGDWQVQFDFENEDGHSKPFPPEIAVVSGEGSRPDGVMWSMATNTVIWIELTSPWEENFQKNNTLKQDRYNQLAVDLRNGKHIGGIKWNVIPLYVEIGARGPIHEHSWNWMCSKLGFWGKARKKFSAAVQDTAIYCSHFIFLCRFLKIWEHKPLLNGWKASSGAQN